MNRREFYKPCDTEIALAGGLRCNLCGMTILQNGILHAQMIDGSEHIACGECSAGRSKAMLKRLFETKCRPTP